AAKSLACLGLRGAALDQTSLEDCGFAPEACWAGWRGTPSGQVALRTHCSCRNSGAPVSSHAPAARTLSILNATILCVSSSYWFSSCCKFGVSDCQALRNAIVPFAAASASTLSAVISATSGAGGVGVPCAQRASC